MLAKMHFEKAILLDNIADADLAKAEEEMENITTSGDLGSFSLKGAFEDDEFNHLSDDLS